MDQEDGEEKSVLPELSVVETEQYQPLQSGEVSPVPGEEDGSVAAQSYVTDSSNGVDANSESAAAAEAESAPVVEIVAEVESPSDSKPVEHPPAVEADVNTDGRDALEEKQPVVDETKRDPNLVSVTLRPVDNGWVMGEDWTVDLHNQLTMAEIRTYVETHRGISRHRIQLRLKGKVVPTNREAWTIRRLGIYDGYTIQVEPTLSGAWLWNPKDYYIDKLITDVSAIVESSVSAGSAGRINLKDLNVKIKPPPCIKTSLRVFLRQYPERFYMHTDTTEGDIYVHITKRQFQLPTFGNFSIEIGTFAYYKPKKFDWAGNKDIDDMYKIETLPEEEEALLAEELGGGENKDGAEGGTGVSASASASAKEVAAAEAAARLVALGNDDTVEENTNNGNNTNNDSFNGSFITASEEPATPVPS